MPSASDLSPIPGIFFSFVQANGIRHRLASHVRNLPQSIRDGSSSMDRNNKKRNPEKKKLVLFLHGFPESWYSWRHQLTWLMKDQPNNNNNVIAVAPDMRGYGSTDQPRTIPPNTTNHDNFVDPAYTQPILANDVVSIAQTLGFDQFVVVGHDWGAQLAWTVALLFPHKVLGVCAMSVPYAGTPKKYGLLTSLQKQYGQCLPSSVPPPNMNEEEESTTTFATTTTMRSGQKVPSRDTMRKARFHYMLHHCLPYADQEYDKNRDEFLYRVYAYSKRGCSSV